MVNSLNFNSAREIIDYLKTSNSYSLLNEENLDEKFYHYPYLQILWRTRIKKLFPEFAYACVPDYQKRGAVHYII